MRNAQGEVCLKYGKDESGAWMDSDRWFKSHDWEDVSYWLDARAGHRTLKCKGCGIDYHIDSTD